MTMQCFIMMGFNNLVATAKSYNHNLGHYQVMVYQVSLYLGCCTCKRNISIRYYRDTGKLRTCIYVLKVTFQRNISW